jgi:type IV/VI secretion system ImpK/VasF family protein
MDAIKNNENGSLLDIFSGFFSLAIYLKESQNLGYEDELQERILGMFRSSGRQARAARENDPNIDKGVEDSQYALAAFIDESLAYNSSINWKTKLQSSLFQTNIAGEEVFQRLDTLMKLKDRKDVLEIYYMCLAFGYKGKYLDDPEKIKEYIDALRSILYTLFTADLSLQSSLDKGQIPEDIRKGLSEKGVSLSSLAKLSKQGDAKWLITDGKENYSIEKDEKVKAYVTHAPESQDEETKDTSSRQESLYPLFDLDPEVIIDLKAKQIPPELKKGLQGVGIELYDPKIISQGNENWLIRDGTNAYKIKREGQLSVYRELSLYSAPPKETPKKAENALSKWLPYIVLSAVILLMIVLFAFSKIGMSRLANDVVDQVRNLVG